MSLHRANFVILAVLMFSVSSMLRAEDYVRLKNGETLTCAILRQDTSAVFTTRWELRHLAQPPLQVYTRDEVESIWFEKPTPSGKRLPYLPRPSQLEGGGSFAFQTWAETKQLRRYMGVVAFYGGFTIIRQLGVELEGDFTLPMFENKSDSGWSSMKTGYQVLMNGVVHPVVWKGFVPYFVAGGGAALGAIPYESLILSNNTDIRAVVDFGLGLKWGSNGVGYSIEWRHHYYSWTPDVTVYQARAKAQSGDLSVVRASIFLYR